MPDSLQPYMPDGRPAPYCMTAAEVCEFCRGGSKTPKETTRYYREHHGLRPTMFGRRIMFLLPDVLDLLKRIQERNPR